MIPNKIELFMGYNNLALVLEQEKKHWLMKTDKSKQLQDKVTGDIFQGYIDNLGSDIKIESEKLPIKNSIVQSIKYLDTNVNKILNIDYPAFPYSSQVNGLMIARIISTTFPYKIGTEYSYKHYKLRLKNCEIVYIPFASSVNSSDVFVGKWIKTTSAPCLAMIGSDGTFSIEHQIDFTTATTNAVFYYPLEETLQPLNMINTSGNIYETDVAISDDGYIGYPLYWFTCDQSIVYPNMSFSNNKSDNGNDILFISNKGNESNYLGKLYFGITGLPDENVTDATKYTITVNPNELNSFTNTSNDFNIAIKPTIVISSGTKTYTIAVNCSTSDAITMVSNVNWTYVDNNTYRITDVTEFMVNDYTKTSSPLIEMLNIHFDESVKPYNTTTDIGFAGIQMSSSNPGSDKYSRYPYDLNLWDGLPEWLSDDYTVSETLVPQHMCLYAIHNTPTYSPELPDSRQVAALLFDPGKSQDATNEDSNDIRGRIYYLSNDDIEYENNAKSEYPKPDRTLARICDVPTSVVQLSGISGIAPTSIVDSEYVRTTATYTTEDKDRIYNTLHTSFVKPTMLDYAGNKITTYSGQTNDYAFVSETLLNKVDMLTYNDLRIHTNINPMVNPLDVELAAITTRGAGYVVDDIGTVIVGGFAFNYTVTEIDKQGGVTNLVISADKTSYINLSNFTLAGNSGVTDVYGSSPLTGIGKGLKFKMVIRGYDDLKPSKGESYADLFAFVNTLSGLWLYTYAIDENSTDTPKAGVWKKQSLISEFTQSNFNVTTGGLTAKDAQLDSMIPIVEYLPCVLSGNVINPLSGLKALVTPTFVNIIDQQYIPFTIPDEVTKKELNRVEIDMCGFYCDGIKSGTVVKGNKTLAGILMALKGKNEFRYDSYIFYKFNDDTNASDLKFTYGIIQRNFNNLLSTDSTTKLPVNDLKVKTYVHSNESTTVVWNTPMAGTMMWMYNPMSVVKEKYTLDPDTRDLTILRDLNNWDDIKIRNTSSSSNISLVDSTSKKLKYNIVTNNITQVGPASSEGKLPVYQQPDYTLYEDLKLGTPIANISKAHYPMGHWALVHPRVESFSFANLTTNRKFTPMKMRIVKGEELGDITDITDDDGNIVNTKCLVINNSSSGSTASVYNTTSGEWQKI